MTRDVDNRLGGEERLRPAAPATRWIVPRRGPRPAIVFVVVLPLLASGSQVDAEIEMSAQPR